jgi:hypothetical protein
MEKGFVDSPAILQQYDIFAYYRFKDDILIIAKSRAGVRAFVLELMRKSKYYAIKVESVSGTSCKMLDLRIWWDTAFYTKVEIKDTAMGMPLSHESNHAPSIHFNWPKAYIQRLYSLCTTPSDKKAAIETFLARLSSHYAHPRILSSLKSFSDSLFRGAISKKPKESIENSCWLVIPYHPIFAQCVKEELKTRNVRRDKFVWYHAFSDVHPVPREPDIMISWTNKEPTIETWLRKPSGVV